MCIFCIYKLFSFSYSTLSYERQNIELLSAGSTDAPVTASQQCGRRGDDTLFATTLTRHVGQHNDDVPCPHLDDRHHDGQHTECPAEWRHLLCPGSACAIL